MELQSKPRLSLFGVALLLDDDFGRAVRRDDGSGFGGAYLTFPLPPYVLTRWHAQLASSKGDLADSNDGDGVHSLGASAWRYFK